MARSNSATIMERHRMIRQLVGIMVTDMVEATDARLREEQASNPRSIFRN